MSGASYRRVEFTQRGEDFQNELRIAEAAIPESTAGHIVVKVHSASINPVDAKIKARMGRWDVFEGEVFLAGYDFSGVVSSVAAKEDRFAVGDQVFGCNWGWGNHGLKSDNFPRGGAFGEYMLVPLGCVSRKPAAVSHAEAAAVALVGITAWEGLDKGQVGTDTRLLVLGGATAVGTQAVQLAKLRGAWVAATASSRNVDYVKGLGADRVINYQTEQWWADEALKPTVIMDAIGSEDTIIAKAKAVLPAGGSFVSICGWTDAGTDPAAHPPLRYAASFVLSRSSDTQDKLAGLLAEGRLRVPIDQRFPFTHDGVVGLYQKIHEGKSVGKNVLDIAARASDGNSAAPSGDDTCA